LIAFVKQELKKKPVTTRLLQQWASQAALQFEDFDFTASKSWLNRFKASHNIRQREITRYIKSKSALDTATITRGIQISETCCQKNRILR